VTEPRRTRLFSRESLLIFGGLIAVGLAVRVAFAFATRGIPYDIDSLDVTARALHGGGQGVYDGVRWPYPGGFLPILAIVEWLRNHTSLPFYGLVKLPSILADLGIAWLVAVALRWGGASERRALIGAALVALGPSFIAISGYHGQIDDVAVLPALAGVIVWTRGGERRALWAGLLIGLGVAVKQPVCFAALALMPSAASWRERGVVIAGTVAVPVLSVLPFLITSADDVVRLMRQNNGVPGFGGLSVFVQPELTKHWAVLHGTLPRPNSATLQLVDAQRTIVALGAVAAAGLAWWKRLPPLKAASLIYLTIFVVNPNWGYEYLIWGLPFFIAAGYVEGVALFQAAVLPATLWLYWRPGFLLDGWTYIVAVQVVWFALVATLAYVVARLIRSRSDSGSRSRTRLAGTPA
jgi:hypothetical protein